MRSLTDRQREWERSRKARIKQLQEWAHPRTRDYMIHGIADDIKRLREIAALKVVES